MSHDDDDDDDDNYDIDKDFIHDRETNDSFCQDQNVFSDVCSREKKVLRAQTFHSKLPLISMYVFVICIFDLDLFLTGLNILAVLFVSFKIFQSLKIL
jgi:hypothetical protein